MSFGDELRQKTEAAKAAANAEARKKINHQDQLKAKRKIDAIPGILESAAGQGEQSCTVYELEVGDSADGSMIHNKLLEDAELNGVRPELFTGIASLVYEYLMTLDGVTIELTSVPKKDEGQARHWVSAAFVVKW